MSDENKTAAEVAAEVKSHLEDKVKAVATEITGRIEAGDKVTIALKEQADELLTKLNEQRAEITDLAQKMARRGEQDEQRVKSFGEQFVESPSFKAYQDNNYQGSAKVSFKEISSLDVGVQSQRDPGIVRLGTRNDVAVRDLLTVVQTDSGSVDFVRQTTRTNNAAAVAEAVAKPYSDYIYETVNAPVRTIAHLAKITRQAMDDQTQLRGEIDFEMRYGLRLAEDAQLLNGSGAGANLNGMITQATAYVAPFDPAGTETGIDLIRLGALQAELAGYPADGVVMNPTDWVRIELLKTTEGSYLYGNPATAVAARLWNLPVASTQAIAVDKFLVGAFQAQTLYDRMAPEVLISSENVDDFEKNMLTMRCEERVALAVKRPQALIYGDFGNVV